MIINLNARDSRVYTELSSRALRHYDRHLVYLPLTTLIRKDTNYKVTWLSVAEPALGINRQEEWRRRSRTDRMLQDMQRNMFSWLKKKKNSIDYFKCVQHTGHSPETHHTTPSRREWVTIDYKHTSQSIHSTQSKSAETYPTTLSHRDWVLPEHTYWSTGWDMNPRL
jgi:hypothetical protein